MTVTTGESEPIQRDGRMWPRHKCGTIWKQSGNRTGHCSNCHRTFDGITAFDRHQRHVDGKLVCLDPFDLMDEGVPYRQRIGDGPWDALTIYWRLENGSMESFLERVRD